MFFQYKNKGILVLVYVVVSLVVTMSLMALIKAYCFHDKMLKHFYGVAFGVAILVSGFWTYYTSDDYYIDENGEKQYMYFDHQFMFMDMKSWAYVFWAIGGFILLGSVYEVAEALLK